MGESRSKRRFLPLLCMTVLFSCQSPDKHDDQVATSGEAANIFVSALPPIPWSSIATKLAPQNNLTIDQARAWAAQTTEAQVEQFLSTFAGGLALRLPALGNSSASASPSGMPSAALPPNSPAPDLNKIPPVAGVDGRTVLMSGSGIYEQSKRVDNQYLLQVLPENYRGHLVTFQVSLQPVRRGLSYDVYVDVTLLPASWTTAKDNSDEVDRSAAGLPPIIIYPLVIADAMETTSVSRTIQEIRQAALQLAGAIHGVEIGGSLGGASDKGEAQVGLDKNSLVTLGRVNDDTFRVRLGAENSGSVGLAMVPQVYDVSILVLTRWGSPEGVTGITAISHATFISASGASIGKQLQDDPGRNRTKLAMRVRKAVHEYGYVLDPAGSCKPNIKERPYNGERTSNSEIQEPEITKYLNLLRAVDRQDYAMFEKCLIEPEKPTGKSDLQAVQADLTRNRLIERLEEIQVTTRYATLEVPLPKGEQAALPPDNQLALYSDDKKRAIFSLYNAQGLTNSKDLKADLLVTTAPQTSRSRQSSVPARSNLPPGTALVSTSIAITGDGSEVDISFPSLDEAKLVPATTQPLRVYLHGENPKKYAVRRMNALPEPVKNPVSASSAALTPDQNNTARLRLTVGDTSKIAGTLYVAVDGADVIPDATINAPALTSKGVAITSSGVTLEFGNLTPARPVKLTTVAIDSASSPPTTTLIGEPIILPVIPAAPLAK